jgi:hypothetical protein
VRSLSLLPQLPWHQIESNRSRIKQELRPGSVAPNDLPLPFANLPCFFSDNPFDNPPSTSDSRSQPFLPRPFLRHRHRFSRSYSPRPILSRHQKQQKTKRHTYTSTGFYLWYRSELTKPTKRLRRPRLDQFESTWDIPPPPRTGARQPTHRLRLLVTQITSASVDNFFFLPILLLSSCLKNATASPPKLICITPASRSPSQLPFLDLLSSQGLIVPMKL